MLGKLYNLVAVVAVATLLGGGGFLCYLYGSGKLTAQRVDLLAAVLRGDLDEQAEGLVASGEISSEPQAEEVRARSAEEVRALRQREHLERLEVERALADLEAQRRLLSHAMHEVVVEQERLEDEQAAFTDRRQQIISAAKDEGFQKELAYIETLSPRQAKEHIVRVWRRDKADAVRLLIELDVARGRRIFEQFKTKEELDIQTDLLERIRLQGLEGYATTSGTIDGGSNP